MANNSDNSGEKRGVDKGGGAYIGGNVTVGGDFVGRDQTKTVIEQQVSLEDFRHLLGEFGQLLKQSGVSGDEAEVIEGDFKVVEQQAAKDKPNGAIVKSRLNSIMEMLKDSAGAAGHVEKIMTVGGKLAKWAGVLFV
jgi:hypothetical protein